MALFDRNEWHGLTEIATVGIHYKRHFDKSKNMTKELTESLNKNLKDYLKFYFSIENPQFAILINGKWGSGKTFFIKNQLIHWNKKNGKDNADNIVLKPIYISLYGVSNTNEISAKIREALNPLLYSKGAKIVKNVFLGAIKTATHINFDTDGDGKSDGKVSFDINSLGILKSSDKKIKGNKILIFDDLERCSIKIIDLFGYINEFVEHFNCKVILLSDEDKIYRKCEENKDSYEEFKEKLIGQTFIIQPDVRNAINSFINKSTKSIETQFLLSSINLIESVFIASKIENLRILKQSILDFERFTLQFEDSLIQHSKYKQFLNSLLGHFLLVYLEYKSGNQKISELGIYNISDDQKKFESQIKSKYDEILDKFEVYHRMSVIEYRYIIEFINNGYSNTSQLNDSLKKNGFFRDTELKDWEKLWSWEELDDSEFEKIYKSVLDDFNNSNFSNPYILLHVVTIIFSLIEKKIVDGNKSKLVESYKKQFDAILENNKNEAFSHFGDHSWGKGYREKDCKEFKELLTYINEKVKIHNSQNKDDYLKTVFETLDDENISQLQEKLDKPLPDRSSNYSFVPILTTVNGQKLAEKLLLLNNKNLELFFYFLQRRYYPEKIYSNGFLEPFNAQDIDCLIELKNRFNSELPKLKIIKKHNVANHINFLTDLIDKLDKLNKEEKK